MSDDTSVSPKTTDTGKTDGESEIVEAAGEDAKQEMEIGGRDGPDPTRYGDWEKAGRCIDF